MARSPCGHRRRGVLDSYLAGLSAGATLQGAQDQRERQAADALARLIAHLSDASRPGEALRSVAAARGT